MTCQDDLATSFVLQGFVESFQIIVLVVCLVLDSAWMFALVMVAVVERENFVASLLLIVGCVVDAAS